MKQSQNDSNIYQALTLKNGLRVLLIHNNESQKSAAALAVNVGHFSDPEERQGMAHFLEHMLFLGTSKYPDGSEYQKFISQFGGNHNAWTATEHTCFFFDIHHSHFSAALDRFSQFFINPLLSKEFVEKERINIEAEFKLKLKDDIRRLYDVHKETINQQHPFAKFSVGTIDTLNDRPNQSIRDEVQAFFELHYRAQYMTLALEGPQAIADLALLAEQYFAAIKPTSQTKAAIVQPLYQPEHLAVKIAVQPVKNDKKLIISFAMPSIDQYYRHKPESILSYLLGHEGSGSILSLLKQKQWVMELTAGSGINGSNFKDFNIGLSLTELGEQHINDIVDVVFCYIQLLKKAPLPEFYYREKQAIAALSFHYHEKMRPLDSVCQAVVNMQHYPVDDYIFGDYVMDGMCQDSITYLLGFLSADNMRLIHVSQNNHFDKTSFWYQVPYNVEHIAAEQRKHWDHIALNEHLYLPDPNPYITAAPKVLPDETLSDNPEIIAQTDGITIWYKQDNTFKTPKGHIYVGIDSRLSVSDDCHIAMTRLFADLYSDAVIEQNYDAELAGIHYHLYAHQGGMTLQLSGISENQPALLTRLLQSLKHHKFEEKRFLLLKHQLQNHWQNADKSKSISQLFSKLSAAMQPNNPYSEALAAALSTVSFAQFELFAKQVFSQITIEVLIHGNWLSEHAQAIGDSVKQAFAGQYSAQYSVQCPVVDIYGQGEILMPITLPEHDHAAVLYFPARERSLKTVALTIITSQLLSPLFFQQMRTEKQYGYLVGVGYIPINRFPGLAFYIQSPDTKAIELAQAMDSFIEDSVAHLNDMIPEDWQHLQQGLVGQLQEKDTSLRIKSQRFWMSICNKDTAFNHKNLLLTALQDLSLDDVAQFIKSQLLKSQHPDRITLISLKNEQEFDDGTYLAAQVKTIENFSQIALRKH